MKSSLLVRRKFVPIGQVDFGPLLTKIEQNKKKSKFILKHTLNEEATKKNNTGAIHACLKYPYLFST